ncbi:MAG TPA: hypothetical protein VKK81_16000 [Candidatus Binatia bacterium]|nr:hypothetical protein [Candidatus Binatia bacterium]
MNDSLERFPKFVTWSMIVLMLVVGVGGSVLGFFVLRPHLGAFLSVTALLAVALLFTRRLYSLLEHPVTVTLAALCGLEVRQYESCRHNVRYFLLGKEYGFRYFHGIGLLGRMECIDWLNDHEFKTLKEGGTLER